MAMAYKKVLKYKIPIYQSLLNRLSTKVRKRGIPTVKKNKETFNKLIIIIFLGVIIFNIGGTVWSLREKYFTFNYREKYTALEKAYYDSIYKNKFGTWLPDEILYSYIGGALTQGKSPILLNPEVPPLGTYIIGLTILIFNNQHIVILLFGSLSLVLIYLIGKQIYFLKTTSIVTTAFFSSEPIFKNQLTYTPLLDIIQLVFLLGIFYFFNKFINEKKKLLRYALIINFLLGAFISTKFFGTGIAVVVAITLTLMMHLDIKRLRMFILTLPLAIFVLYLSYIKVLIDGYPLNRFLGIQKWIFLYNKGHVTQPFTIWPLLLLNKWYVWFGNVPVISDPQWIITWPIITIISLISILKNLILKIAKKEVEILFFWILVYLILMSFVQASSRYLVILIPFLYLVSIYGIEQFIIKYIKK